MGDNIRRDFQMTQPDPPYLLPPHVVPFLGRGAGVPWDLSDRRSELNRFTGYDDKNHPRGLVKNSFQEFRGASVQAVIYETSKMDVCADGVDSAQPGDTHQPDTALHDAKNRPLSSSRFPYAVLPSPHKNAPANALVQSLGLGLGDLVIIFYRGSATCCVYGDHGPWWKIGESSMLACNQLGVPSNPVTGGLHNVRGGGFVHLAFPGSRDRSDGKTSRAPTGILNDAWELYHKFTKRKARCESAIGI